MTTQQDLPTVSTLCRRRRLVTVHARTPVSQVIQLMAKCRVTAVCVTRRDRLVGIFTMKDVMSRVLGYKTQSLWKQPRRRKMRDVPVRSLMSSAPVTIALGASLEEAYALMKKHRIRHLPVLHGGAIAGMVILRDVVDALERAAGKKALPLRGKKRQRGFYGKVPEPGGGVV